MNDKYNEFSELVGEALGRASVAWSELPSGIFDSDACSVLHIDIMNAYNNEIKKLQAENADLSGQLKSCIFVYEEKLTRLIAENSKLNQEIEKFKGYLEAWDLKD